MLDEIYEEVSKELNIDIKLVKQIHRHKTKWLRDQLRTVSYIHVIDTGFGNYTIMPRKLLRSIKRYGECMAEQKIELYNSFIERYKKLRESHKTRQKRKQLCTN